MPANLTHQYHKAEEAFKSATTTEEKIECLEQMIRVLPKHKGTDHMLADLRRRLSKLKETNDREAKSKKSFNPYRVDKQGAGQALLLGPPNCGKSALVGKLTRAQVTVTPYPFATVLPVPGMMAFEDVQVQLVDLPSIQMGALLPGMLGLIKSTDVILLVADVAAPEVLDEMEALLRSLDEGRARLFDHRSPPEPEPLVKDLPSLLIANKSDGDGAEEVVELLDESLEGRFEILRVSGETGAGLDVIPERVFQMLERIRVYSKEPGKPLDRGAPFVLELGGTVVDLARQIHREFPERLKQARVWGSARFEGQAVAKDYELADGDVVELHVDG